MFVESKYIVKDRKLKHFMKNIDNRVNKKYCRKIVIYPYYR